MVLNYIGLVVGSIVGYIYLRKNKRNKRLRFVLRIVDFAILIAIGLFAVKEGRAYFFAEADKTMEAAINDTFTDEEILAEIGLKKWSSGSDRSKWVDEFRAWTEKTFKRKQSRAFLPYAEINENLQVSPARIKKLIARQGVEFLYWETGWTETKQHGAQITFRYRAPFRLFPDRVEAFVWVDYYDRDDLNGQCPDEIFSLRRASP